ncbi:MAG: ABC transporter permease [Brachybacterium sp.]|nr:ABC transporter permease [Brachybacterium sp.]
MTKYILRRFVSYLILTAIATVTAYMAASFFFNPAARYQNLNPPVPQESIDARFDAIGVNPDTPVLERTWAWIVQIVTAPLNEKLNRDLGNNWVVEEIFSRAGVSLRLLIVGSALAAILGVILGVWGAVRQYKASDQVITYSSFVLISTPTFVGGLLLMLVATWFNNLIGFRLITFTGAYTPGIQGFWPQVGNAAMHLLLPTIALVLFGSAIYSRYQRAIMLDVLGSDFIRTARAKGATRNRALIKHGVRVALIPMSTYFAFSFGTLVAGSAFLEIIFSWAGMGQYGIQAVQQSDVNALTGNVVFTAVLLLISFTLSEILYAALDPRVRV